jgi:hypothetical protein
MVAPLLALHTPSGGGVAGIETITSGRFTDESRSIFAIHKHLCQRW